MLPDESMDGDEGATWRPRSAASRRMQRVYSWHGGRLQAVAADERRGLGPGCKPGRHAVVFFRHTSKHRVTIDGKLETVTEHQRDSCTVDFNLAGLHPFEERMRGRSILRPSGEHHEVAPVERAEVGDEVILPTVRRSGANHGNVTSRV